MQRGFLIGVLPFGGVITYIMAASMAFACDPVTQPCSIIFTLNNQNQLVLEQVEEGPRTEGVLRLTSEQAKSAAKGPLATANILSPKNQTDEFAEVISRLAKVPGLGFLADPNAAHNAAHNATGDAGKAMQLSGAKAGENLVCAQMHLVLKATLDEATEEAFDASDYMTAPEIVAACGHAAGTKMIEWYQAEQLKRQAHF